MSRELRLSIGRAQSVLLSSRELRRLRLISDQSAQLVYYYKICAEQGKHGKGWGGRRYQKFSAEKMVELGMLIFAILQKNPTTPPRTILSVLQKSFNIPLSPSMFFRLLRSWGLTFKKPVLQQIVSHVLVVVLLFSFLQAKFRPSNVQKTILFRLSIVQIDPQKIKYLDESHFVPSNLWRRMAIGPIGQRVFIVNQTELNAPRVTMSLATSIAEGPLFHAVVTTSTNSASNFFRVVLELVRVGFVGAGDVLIIDNAPIHVDAEMLSCLVDLAEQIGFCIRRQPFYSPEFNAWSVPQSTINNQQSTTSTINNQQ